MNTDNITKNQAIDDILATIKQQTIEYSSHYWVPSLKKEIRFRDINTSQQKRLVKSIVDSPVFNTEFILTLSDILMENCVDPEVNVMSLTILDKLALAINLRAVCVGNMLKIQATEKGKSFTVELDLNQIYEKCKTALIGVEAETFDDQVFTITCGVPTIQTETDLERELRGSGNNALEISDPSQLRTTIGDAFMSELVKYITAVSVKSNGELKAVEWSTLSFTDRIRVIEQFNAHLLKKIVGYINKVKEQMNAVELYTVEVDGEKITRRLSIDGNFFIVS